MNVSVTLLYIEFGKHIHQGSCTTNENIFGRQSPNIMVIPIVSVPVRVYLYLYLHLHLYLYLFKFCKECHCNFSADCSGPTLFCVIEVFPHWPINLQVWKVFPISRVCSNLFSKCLHFSPQSPLTSLVRFIFRYLIVFYAVLEGVTFQFLSESLLLTFVKKRLSAR